MLNHTIKGLLALGLALCATAHAQLHISFTETADGNTLVSLSGTVRPSVLGNGYEFESDINDPGQNITAIDHDTIIVSMVNSDRGVHVYDFTGVRMVGDTPISSISYTGPLAAESLSGGGAGFAFKNNGLLLYDGSGNRDWVDWEGYSFVVPQSMTEIGLVPESSGSMLFYDGRSFAEIVTITWSVGSAVPEPAAYAALFGIAVFGCALLRRRTTTPRV